MNDIAIHIEDLGKQYRIGARDDGYKTFREAIINVVKAPLNNLRDLRSLTRFDGAQDDQDVIWALRDVNFDVKQGEVVGIIGGNGAGKSTLLKVLSRITEPTTGFAEIRGRVSSLLEVGTGFHPELTGRENVYLNGTVLGMRRKEIGRKFDEIVEFSGVERFIDTPVKRYSSGMQVRLAFAVAAHLEPEILMVDEVLAVGDASFQEKCLGKIGEVASSGRTVLFVSHNMSAVASLCEQSFWLDSGRIKMSGATGAVVDEYLKVTRMKDGALSLEDRKDRTGTGILRSTEIRLEDKQGNRLTFIKSGQGVSFVIPYVSPNQQRLDDVVAQLVFVNERNQRLFCCMSDVTGDEMRNLGKTGRLVCTFEEMPLVPGHYDLHLVIHANRQLADKIFFAASFQVVEGDFFGTSRLPSESLGSVMVHHSWHAEDGE